MTLRGQIFVALSTVAAACGVLTIAAILRMPGWAFPPTVLALGAGALGVSVAATSGVAQAQGVGWRSVLLGVAVVVVSGVTIGVALVAPREESVARPVTQGVLTQVTDTVRALYSIPADAAARSRRIEFLTGRLTSPLLPSVGSAVPNPVPLPDVPGAESQVDVQRVGVVRSDAGGARLLVFGVVRVRVPGASPPEASAPIARSVVLRRVDAMWRVADVYPVGPGA